MCAFAVYCLTATLVFLGVELKKNKFLFEKIEFTSKDQERDFCCNKQLPSSIYLLHKKINFTELLKHLESRGLE